MSACECLDIASRASSKVLRAPSLSSLPLARLHVVEVWAHAGSRGPMCLVYRPVQASQRKPAAEIPQCLEDQRRKSPGKEASASIFSRQTLRPSARVSPEPPTVAESPLSRFLCRVGRNVAKCCKPARISRPILHFAALPRAHVLQLNDCVGSGVFSCDFRSACFAPAVLHHNRVLIGRMLVAKANPMGRGCRICSDELLQVAN